jgi:alanine dehydrogenase
MIVGVPKEVKADEYRVGIIPAGVEALARRGHTVLVQQEAGVGSGIGNEEYVQAGAQMVARAEELYRRAELIIKVKEPLPQEHPWLQNGQMLFTYFHFAADRELTEAIMKSGCVAIAYETVRTPDGRHPLLTPMSEVAGRMSIQEGAKYLEKPMEGRGILLGGVPGVAPAKVVIVGGGVVGTNAAKVAAGLGAQAIVLDIDVDRLRYLDDIMPKNVVLLMSDAYTVRQSLSEADLVIGAVLIEGARAPVLIHREDLSRMKPGSVIIDVAVDQGGCVETSKPTTHSNPIFIVDGVVHYCVSNMPGAVGRTSTYALCNVTLPYALPLADKGYERAARENSALQHGVNVARGRVTNEAVANTFGLPYQPLW